MIDKQKEIIEHNSNIIEDNMFFGWKNGYSEKEINQYEAEARRNLKILKKHLKDGGQVEWNQEQQIYVPKTE